MEITHNRAAHRFEHTPEDGATAVLEYYLEDNTLDLQHTKVPPAHEGQGIGSALAKYALEYARAHNLKVIPSCPFVEQFIQSHPEYQNLIQAS